MMEKKGTITNADGTWTRYQVGTNSKGEPIYADCLEAPSAAYKTRFAGKKDLTKAEVESILAPAYNAVMD